MGTCSIANQSTERQLTCFREELHTSNLELVPSNCQISNKGGSNIGILPFLFVLLPKPPPTNHTYLDDLLPVAAILSPQMIALHMWVFSL